MTAPPFEAALFMAGSFLLAWATHVLIWRRLILKTELPRSWRIPARRLFASAAALFPAGMLQLLFMRHVPHALARPVMSAAFTWLGIIIFLLWGMVIFEVWSLFIRFQPALQSVSARICLIAAVAVALFSIAQAAERPSVSTVEIGVVDALAGYHIVQLSDLHIGPTLARTFAGEVTKQVNLLAPDLIVISGDLVDGSVAEIADEVAPLAALHANDGVIFILGNHEYLSGAEDWVKQVQSFGWHVLRNERLALPRLDVVGLDEFADPDSGIYAFPNSIGASTQTDLSRRRPTLVVSHTPAAFVASCRAGVDIALAGHTHGGQFYPLGLLEWLQQGYLAGSYHCGGTQLYVSSGTGYWGPPMRLGSHNEISLLELVRR